MDEVAWQMVPGEDASGHAQAAPVFLCHNSQDKRRVKEVADALELEFGTPFFFDAYAIPTGEAFIPFIEKALGTCSGCAIFLGANGWGPTHLWEAEQALLRYRTDPQFKLIPVVLSGVREEDMRKLGAGRVFQEINWADFSEIADEHESARKLGAALLGEDLPQYRGPARLTPFQIRRDAARWEASNRTEKSILYRGKQLEEAKRMAAENPDFVVLDKSQPFLSAADARQNTIWRWISIGGVSGTVIFLILFAATYVAYGLAEQRRLDSVSRQLSIAAHEAPGADRMLLISARALMVSDTPEARGNLMQQLEEWRYLRRIMHLDSGAEAVAIGPGEEVSVGTDDANIVSWARDSAAVQQVTPLQRSDGAVTAIKALGSQRWIGREDGAVDVEMSGSAGKSVRRVLAPSAAAPGKDQRVLVIETRGAGDSALDLVAVGTASGQLTILSAATQKVLARFDEGDDLRVTSLAFDSRKRWLAAGTGSQFVLLVDLASLKITQRQPGIDGGAVTVGFDANDFLAVVSSFGVLTVFKTQNGTITSERSRFPSGLISSAAIDGKRGRVALGDASGLVRLYDLFGSPVAFGALRAHSDPVEALAFGVDENTLISTSSNGTVAIWDLGGGAGISTPIPGFAPEPSLLRVDQRGGLVAAATTTGKAGIWTLGPKVWTFETDLIEATRSVAGSDSINSTTVASDASGGGFQPIDDAEIPAVTLDDEAGRAAWTTRRGMVLLLDQQGQSKAARVIEAGGASGAIELSGKGTVLAYAVRKNQGVVVATLEDGAGIRKRGLDLPRGQQVRSLAVSQDGNYVAVGFENGKIGIYSAQTGQALHEPLDVQQGAAVGGMAFSANGRELVSFGSGGGGLDRSIAILPVPAMGEIRRLQSHQAEGSVSALSIGTTSSMLAAGDHDGQVLLWRLSDAHFIASLRAGSNYVPGVLLDDAGHRLVTVSSDGAFLSWELDPTRWIKLACEKANRPWRADEWKELMPDDTYDGSCLSRHKG